MTRNILDLFVETTATVKKISNDDLELLRQFDLDMAFGPCTGKFLCEIFVRRDLCHRYSTY